MMPNAVIVIPVSSVLLSPTVIIAKRTEIQGSTYNKELRTWEWSQWVSPLLYWKNFWWTDWKFLLYNAEHFHRVVQGSRGLQREDNFFSKFSTFQLEFMQLGLINAPTTFQGLTNEVMKESEHSIRYVYDVLSYWRTTGLHMSRSLLLLQKRFED